MGTAQVDVLTDGTICCALGSNGNSSLWDLRSGSSIEHVALQRASTVQLLSSTSTKTPMLAMATLDEPSSAVLLYDVRHMAKPCVHGAHVPMRNVSALKTDGQQWVAGTTDGDVWSGSFQPAGQDVLVKSESEAHADGISCLEVLHLQSSPSAQAPQAQPSRMMIMTGSLDGSAALWS